MSMPSTRVMVLKAFAATAAILALYCFGYYLGAHAKHPNNAFGMFGICMIPATMLFVLGLWHAARPLGETQTSESTTASGRERRA